MNLIAKVACGGYLGVVVVWGTVMKTFDPIV